MTIRAVGFCTGNQKSTVEKPLKESTIFYK